MRYTTPLTLLTFTAIAAMGSSLLPAADTTTDEEAEMPKTVLGCMMLWSMPDSYRFELGAFSKDGSTFGSFYENAPLIPYAGERGDYQPGHFVQIFKDARAGGVDVIDLDCFDDVSFNSIFWWLEEARLSGTGVKISLMLDRMPKRGPQFLAELWKHPEIINHPNLFKVGPKPFITSYGYRDPAFWETLLSNAHAAGGNYVVIGDLSSLGADVWEKGIIPEKALPSLSLLSGGWYFGGDPSLFTTGHSIVESLKEWATEQSPPKLFGASVRWGYISSRRVGHLVSPEGTTRFRQIWIDILKQNPNFVYLTTLNDYSETAMECSANTGFTFLDMNRYFSQRWKSGQWPALEQPEAFVSYRKALAVDEPAVFEVVLLTPEISGTESAGAIAQAYTAQCEIALSDGRTVNLREVEPSVLPGHLCWRFDAEGFPTPGFGTPEVTIRKNGREIDFPQGDLASFAIVGPGDTVARAWLNVPLHRIYPDTPVTMKVAGSPANQYPRTITFEGLPAQEVVGGVIELNANSLNSILSPDTLAAGYVENFYAGPGYGPMLYEDGFAKRTVMDQLDRYTAVIRMSQDRLLYPRPVQVEAPHVDPATVQDFIFSAESEELVDRGPLRRNLSLPKDESARPATRQDPGSKVWYLHFNGTSNFIRFGEDYSPHGKDAMTMPPGPATVEVWIRPGKSGKTQALFASERPVLDLELQPDLTVRLTRTDQQRQPVVVNGESSLSPDRWHHVVAVFTGADIRLFVDGKEDAQPVPCHGVRTESDSVLGANVRFANRGDYLAGDIGRFRILQRSLSPDEIAEIYQAKRDQFSASAR